MTKQAYDVEGDFQMGRIRQHFKVQVVGDGEDDAREAVYTDLGSRHGALRREIEITSIGAAKEIDPINQKKLE